MGWAMTKNFSKYWMFWLLLFFCFFSTFFWCFLFSPWGPPQRVSKYVFYMVGFLEVFLMFFCFLHGALPKESKYCCSCFFPRFFAGPSLKSLKYCVFFLKVFFPNLRSPRPLENYFCWCSCFLLFKFGVPRTCGLANVLHLGCVF